MASVISAAHQVAPTVSVTNPKPLLRRPTLVRKRGDVEEEIVPQSPGKRPKVSFDQDVEVRIVDELPNAPQLIQEEVRLAFDKRTWSDDSGYERIKEVYDSKRDPNDEVSSTMLRNYTAALVANIPRLNRHNSDLVQMVIKSQWLGRQEEYVALFARLLGNISAMQGLFLGDVMRMLVENLTSAPPSSGRLPNLPCVARSTIFVRVHKTLQYLLRLVPSASRVLALVLVDAFPHETDTKRTHNIYVKNLLELVEYAPELRTDILALITDRLVKLDVGVQEDLEDLAEDVGEGLVEKVSKVEQDMLDDVDNSDLSDTESEDEEEDEDEQKQRAKDIMKNVGKMDSILDILFTYYNQYFSDRAVEDQIGLIDTLLSQFVTIILPAQRSRHTQFLLFHFAQKSPNYIDTLVGTCVEITFDRKKKSTIMRQASAAYLASFVARGMHVPSNIVRDVFDYIGNELERLRREYEPTCKGPELRRYCSFYSLVQALLYIFCFRWRDLLVSPDDDDGDNDLTMSCGQEHQWRSGVKEALSQSIFSKLNPLKVCSPAIVTEFARIAHHLGAVYVFHLIETNKRVRLPQFSATASAGYKHNQPDRETALSMSGDESHQYLDEYFPFDPYHLPTSKRWVDGDYREWAGIPGLDNEQDSDSECEEDDTGASDEEEGTETDETGRFT